MPPRPPFFVENKSNLFYNVLMNENDYRLKAYANAGKSGEMPKNSQGEVFFTPLNLANNNFKPSPLQDAPKNSPQEIPPKNLKKEFESNPFRKENHLPGAKDFFEKIPQVSPQKNLEKKKR